MILSGVVSCCTHVITIRINQFESHLASIFFLARYPHGLIFFAKPNIQSFVAFRELHLPRVVLTNLFVDFYLLMELPVKEVTAGIDKTFLCSDGPALLTACHVNSFVVFSDSEEILQVIEFVFIVMQAD